MGTRYFKALKGLFGWIFQLFRKSLLERMEVKSDDMSHVGLLEPHQSNKKKAINKMLQPNANPFMGSGSSIDCWNCCLKIKNLDSSNRNHGLAGSLPKTDVKQSHKFLKSLSKSFHIVSGHITI